MFLFKLDQNGVVEQKWTKVPAIIGNNVIYNSISKKIRNIYSVLSRVDDRVSLIFADGTFGNLPQGDFRVYYRTSSNRKLVITPNDMRGISIDIDYISNTGKIETLIWPFLVTKPA